ncbi:MAG: zinc-dependent alcohol dehydrogenase [Alphaproteobacteria bacterium]
MTQKSLETPVNPSREAADDIEHIKVIACRPGGATAMELRPAPSPGDGEMVLALRAVGLCGTDMFKLDTAGAPDGAVLGHELVGEVIALGSGVDAFSLGDRVAVPHHVPCGECLLCRRGSETMCEIFHENLLEPGGFADRILVRERAVALAARRLPDGLGDEAAVFMEPAACVLRGVRRSGIGEGDAAVVQGACSMGLLHLLVLRAMFPGLDVTMIDPVAARRALAEELGAARSAPPEGAAEAVEEATGGIGAGAVFDTVGGAGLLEGALALCREGGSVVLFAHAPERDCAGFDLNNLFKFERRIIGTYSAALKEQAEIFELLSSGALDPSPLVTHRMPLDDFTQGVELVRRREALKILFTPSRRTQEA